MDHAAQFLTDNLPGHDVKIAKRPDGKLLVTLSSNGEAIFMKAVEPQSVVEEGLKSLLREIQRDRKLVSGEVSWKGAGAQWVHRSLPTFTGAPVNPTAAKTMWKRRQANSYRSSAVSF